jgi:branched-chain amino acid transport system ATP-binding protein
MLQLNRVHTHYGRMAILKGVSLQVREEEIVTVLGANGAGKTTMLKAISGVVRPTSGDIQFLGVKISGLPPKQIVRQGICHVPEGRGMFPYMTVLENLELGAVTRNDREEIRKDLQNIFRLFPLLEKRTKQLAGSLSGGEQQMVTIGRGLMSRPKLCLLDEPSLGLAPTLVKELSVIIKNINDQRVTVLLVEQNARMALNLAHRGYVLETGEIILEGKATDLIQDERVKKAYLGM